MHIFILWPKKAFKDGETLDTMTTRFLRCFLLVIALLLPNIVYAQSDAASAEVDHLLTRARQESAAGNHSAALSSYVRIIARQPNDALILMAAGKEALALGDSDAAFGFLGRAVTLSPRNAEARAAYGTALTLNARPKDALTLFDQATRLGIAEGDIAGDRGLARDLLGESKRAQRDYRKALESKPGDVQISQRLALSLAISGERNAALDILKALPAAAQTREVERTRAFVLAMTGDLSGARRIALAHVTPAQADAFTPFFARISVLGAAEKAGAVHLGHLPAVRLAQNERAIPLSVTMPDEKPSTLRAVNNGEPAATRPRKEVASRQRRANDNQPAAAVAGSVGEASAASNVAVKVEQRAVVSSGPQSTVLTERKSAATTETQQIAENASINEALKRVLGEDCASLSGSAKVQCEANARALARRCTLGQGRPTAECVALTDRLTTKTEPAAAVASHKAEKPANVGTSRAVAQAVTTKPLTADTLIANDCTALTGRARVQCEADIRALARRCNAGSGAPTAECVAYRNRLEVAAVADGQSDKANVAKGAARKGAAATDGPASTAQVARATATTTATDICAALSGAKAVQCRADQRALARRCGGKNPPSTAECIAYAEAGQADQKSAVGQKPTAAKAQPATERHWVQISGGRNRADFTKEWQRLKGSASAILNKHTPYVGKNGESFRLVVGPFDDAAATRVIVNSLAKSGISSFAWTSRAGEAVDPL